MELLWPRWKMRSDSDGQGRVTTFVAHSNALTARARTLEALTFAQGTLKTKRLSLLAFGPPWTPFGLTQLGRLLIIGVRSISC